MPLFKHDPASILQHPCPNQVTRGCFHRLILAAGSERRHKLGKIEAIRHNVRALVGIRGRHRIAPVQFEEVGAVVSRMTGALMRAFLVIILIITPSVILPGIEVHTRQMVALLALFGGALIFTEYNASYPSMIEFRDASPFNRLRYVFLLTTVISLALISAAEDNPTSLARLFATLGTLTGEHLDFPYSPVRLASLMLAEGATIPQQAALRTAAGTSYALSLISLALFIVVIRRRAWPGAQSFNLWVNLPTFQPSAGGDVVQRLERDARINLSLGFLLPFIIPAVVTLVCAGIDPLRLTSPQTLIWTMAVWAFFPASLMMRGIAMYRIAAMIRSQRKEHSLETGKSPRPSNRKISV